MRYRKIEESFLNIDSEFYYMWRDSHIKRVPLNLDLKMIIAPVNSLFFELFNQEAAILIFPIKVF